MKNIFELSPGKVLEVLSFDEVKDKSTFITSTDVCIFDCVDTVVSEDMLTSFEVFIQKFNIRYVAFVGTGAEDLHDRFDDLLEDTANGLDITTTYSDSDDTLQDAIFFAINGLVISPTINFILVSETPRDSIICNAIISDDYDVINDI